MPRPVLNLKPSTSADYARFAAEAAAQTEVTKKTMISETKQLYEDIIKILSKIDIENIINTQKGEVSSLSELRGLLRQILKDTTNLAKKQTY